MNIAAVFYGLSCLVRPSLLRPSLVYDEFSDIPANISDALSRRKHARQSSQTDEKTLCDIRAVVLDKDNCFAAPRALCIWPAYKTRWDLLRQQFPRKAVLIVSNSAGTRDDVDHVEASTLSSSLQTEVLRHSDKKPACSAQVMETLRNAAIGVQSPSQVVVIGDRLFTDVLMANLMGCHSIWIRRGVIQDFGILTRLERSIYSTLQRFDIV